MIIRAVEKYVVESVEDRLGAWREAENAAVAAENAIAKLGQAAADPRTRDLFIQAGKLRVQADRLFAAIVRSVELDDSDQ